MNIYIKTLKANNLVTRMIPVILVLTFFPSVAAAQLEWRVSVKMILDTDGNRPKGQLSSNANVQAQINMGNQALNATGRGYRLRLTEIIDLNGVSQWFDSSIDWNTKVGLEAAAKLDPARYAWRADVINLYTNNATTGAGGIASFPIVLNVPTPWTGEIVLIGQRGGANVFIHEIGHYLSLCHTQGCLCGACDSIDVFGTNFPFCTTPGDDGIADTLPDVSCWNQDNIAVWSFGGSYASLSPEQKARVDDTFFNVMSYHQPFQDRLRLTADQMDKLSDISNTLRSNVTNGRTRFVDRKNRCLFPSGASGCFAGTGGPFAKVADGVRAAGAGDIVLIRPGTYNEALTINKPVTLRASRGNVIIGSGL